MHVTIPVTVLYSLFSVLRYNASYPAIQAEETEPFLKGVKYDKP